MQVVACFSAACGVERAGGSSLGLLLEGGLGTWALVPSPSDNPAVPLPATVDTCARTYRPVKSVLRLPGSGAAWSYEAPIEMRVLHLSVDDFAHAVTCAGS